MDASHGDALAKLHIASAPNTQVRYLRRSMLISRIETAAAPDRRLLVRWATAAMRGAGWKAATPDKHSSPAATLTAIRSMLLPRPLSREERKRSHLDPSSHKQVKSEKGTSDVFADLNWSTQRDAVKEGRRGVKPA